MTGHLESQWVRGNRENLECPILHLRPSSLLFALIPPVLALLLSHPSTCTKQEKRKLLEPPAEQAPASPRASPRGTGRRGLGLQRQVSLAPRGLWPPSACPRPAETRPPSRAALASDPALDSRHIESSTRTASVQAQALPSHL